MAWYDFASKTLGAIIPDMDASPARQLRWRMSIAILLLSSVTVQAIQVAIACGWLSSYGISGFAYASDMDDLRLTSRRIESRLIEQRLLDVERTLCKTSGAQVRGHLLGILRDAITDYASLTGRQWTRPTCAELGE